MVFKRIQCAINKPSSSGSYCIGVLFGNALNVFSVSKVYCKLDEGEEPPILSPDKPNGTVLCKVRNYKKDKNNKFIIVFPTPTAEFRIINKKDLLKILANPPKKLREFDNLLDSSKKINFLFDV